MTESIHIRAFDTSALVCWWPNLGTCVQFCILR